MSSQEGEFCLDCQGKEKTFEYGYALWVYDRTMQASISRFKYQGRKEYAEYYAREPYQQYGTWMQKIGVQALVPVPVHRNRYRERGYNQAELIARKLGVLAGIPVREKILIRSRDTLPQKDLSEKERRKNLWDAFQVKNCAEELNQISECVILIDDIYTTGNTLEACSKVMKEAGVQRIYFLCVCIGKGF